jgi:hypothetical protein
MRLYFSTATVFLWSREKRTRTRTAVVFNIKTTGAVDLANQNHRSASDFDSSVNKNPGLLKKSGPRVGLVLTARRCHSPENQRGQSLFLG